MKYCIHVLALWSLLSLYFCKTDAPDAAIKPSEIIHAEGEAFKNWPSQYHLPAKIVQKVKVEADQRVFDFIAYLRIDKNGDFHGMAFAEGGAALFEFKEENRVPIILKKISPRFPDFILKDGVMREIREIFVEPFLNPKVSEAKASIQFFDAKNILIVNHIFNYRMSIQILEIGKIDQK